jgi:hypothetical protein
MTAAARFATACAAALAACACAQVEPIATPHSYVAYALLQNETINIDGRLDDAAWAEVGWSEKFVDISGPVLFPTPYFDTAVKIRWDSTYLYIGALLQETQVWANQTLENSVIFNDNDFEVFVDPDGSSAFYKVSMPRCPGLQRFYGLQVATAASPRPLPPPAPVNIGV